MNKEGIRQLIDERGQVRPDFTTYRRIQKMQPCIFLYEGPQIGHWCCILEHKNSWEIFDPVGMWPDDELKHPKIMKVPAKFRRLCRATGKTVYYNDFPLQTGGRTCGLWVALRWMYRHLTYDEFVRNFSHMTDHHICKLFHRMDLYN